MAMARAVAALWAGVQGAELLFALWAVLVGLLAKLLHAIAILASVRRASGRLRWIQTATLAGGEPSSGSPAATTVPAGSAPAASLHTPSPAPRAAAGLLPGVSVIKAVSGTHPHLEANLRSFFHLDYPADKFELVFCVAAADDPAACVIQRLIQDHKGVAARLYSKCSRVGVNPKINNIYQGVQEARHPFVWISDTSLLCTKDTLRDVALTWTVGTSVVHQVPISITHRCFSDVVEQVYFSTQHARAYLACDALRLNCVNGMSMLLRQEDLAAVGGLEAFAKYIAEDYFITEALYSRGLRPRLSAEPAMQNFTGRGWGVYHRQLRWARLRASMIPLVTLLVEPFTECLGNGLAVAYAVSYFGLVRWSALAVFGAHCLVWALLDIALFLVSQQSIRGPLLTCALAWLVREALSLPVWFHAQSGNCIQWGKRRFVLERGGIAREKHD